MRINRAHIFGFGKWVDQTFEFNHDSFICFYGKNEAGKSTLQQFFLYMLFGLPPRELSRFKPKQSSQIGGILTVSFPSLGEVTIERVERQFRLHLPNGETSEKEETLHEQLNQLQEETYRAIYGFSSLDLMQLHQMKQTELSDLLFSVSLTGSTAVYELERKFTRKLDELFKPSGRRPLINEQITKVNELEKEMLRTKKEALSYRQKVNEQLELEDELEKLDNNLKQVNESFTIKEKTLQFLPQLRSYKQVQDKLATFNQKEVKFPENGIERYELLKQQLIPIKAAHKNVQKTIIQYEQAIIDKSNELYGNERYDQMVSLLEQSSDLKNNEQKSIDLSKKLVEIKAKINEDINKMHMTEDEVRSFQPPFHAEASWKQLIEESISLQHEGERIEEAADVIEQKRQRLHHEQERISSRFMGNEQVEKMRNNTLDQEKKAHQYSSLKTLYDWEVVRKKQSEKLIYLTSMITLIFFVLYFIQANASYLAFGSASFIIAMIQVYVIGKLKKKLSSLEKQMKSMKYTPGQTNISETTIQEQEGLSHELSSINNSLKDLQIEQLQWEEKNSHFNLKENKWISAVELEREKLPLLKKVELEFWPELLQHVDKINARLSIRDEMIHELEITETTIGQFMSKLKEIGSFIAKEEDNFTLNHLQAAVKAHDSLQEQIRQYKQLSKEESQRLALLNEEKNLIKEQMEELFRAVDVKEEEQFYLIARQIEEKGSLEKSATQLKTQLEAIFSETTLLELISSSIDEFTLQREVEKLQSNIEEMEMKKDKLGKQLATLQVEIAQLESSDDYSYATHRYEFEQDKLNDLAKEWSIIKVAQTALQGAKVSYQQKYINDVMHYTSNYFSHLTSERYSNVYPPSEKSTFQVEANNKMRYTVEELSKGTIDQLYVALRFAISKVMSEKFVVPFMIDDAFVHFDEERATLAIQLLDQISEEQQVILYTCRQHVAEAVDETKSIRINL